MNHNESFWTATVTPPEYPVYQGNDSCDVAVVGGGLTGITAAMFLAEKGLKTVILEANKIGSGTTSKTTAKITVQHGLKYRQYIRGIGVENTFLYYKANTIGFDIIKNIINTNNIDCDYTCSSAYVYTEEEKHIHKIENEKKAYDKIGLNSFITNQCKLPFPIKAALVVPDQAYFHPLKYLYALADIFTKNNGKIYEQSQVKTIDKEPPCAVHVNDGTLHAKYIILATNYPFIDMPGYYFLRVYQMRSYLTQTAVADYDIEGMYINTGNPVNTIRSHVSGNTHHLLLGGYNHKTGHNKNERPIFDKISELKKSKFPHSRNNISYEWSTQDSVTLDHIPYIGTLSGQTPNVFIATGYDKWGMTNSAAAAMMIACRITGEKHPVMDTKELFSPARFTPGAAAKEFIILGADAVREYTVQNLIIPQGDLKKIKTGEAKILRINGHIVAIYRKKDGSINAFDARCTHRLCPLKYNQEENSWDCPCHGSRFDMEGNVITGPAVVPLKRIKIEKLKDQ